MKLTGNTILITGGTSGIGLSLATKLLAMGNTVIVTGRDQKQLDETTAKLPGVHAIKSDVSKVEDISALYEHVAAFFPNLNMLFNNAGIMRKIDLQGSAYTAQNITNEIDINLSGPVRMVTQFLPLLKKQKHAAILNVSSGLAFVPLAISPVYSATKFGVHAYTLSLRLQLKNTNIQVFEIAPPGTETPLFRGDFTQEDLGGIKGMNVNVLADKVLAGVKSNTLEIRPGVSNMLKLMSRIAPNFMLKQLGKTVDKMHAQTPATTKGG